MQHSIGFRYLSDEINVAVLLFLHGFEAARVATVSSFLRLLLLDECFWAKCTFREFPATLTCFSKSQSLQAYRTFRIRELCRTLRWTRVPCQHDLGMRGNSPQVFCIHGHLFIFGGNDHATEHVLHGGFLRMPLVLHRIVLDGIS